MSDLGLESDVNNANFAGARNPDEMMWVEFFMGELVDKWATEDSEKNPTRKLVKLPSQPCIRICTPGQAQLNMIERPVSELDKQRWPNRWLYFAAKEGIVSSDIDIPGWKLADWDEMKDQSELVRDLEYKRFMTVEQLAGASDSQLQRIGMNGYALREKAKRALSERMNDATKSAIEERDSKIAELESKMQKMMEMINKDEPKRGRPPKDREAA